MKQLRRMPEKVTTAVNLLWVSLALGIVRGFLEFSNTVKSLSEQGISEIGYIIMIIVALAIFGFFIIMIGKGKNWARITYLVIFLVGVIFSVFSIFDAFSISFISGILSIAQIVLPIISLVFLFDKSSSKWFNSYKNGQRTSKTNN